MGREDALAQAREEAIQKAVSAGADPATVQIVDVEEVPLAYLPSNATRIRMKAVSAGQWERYQDGGGQTATSHRAKSPAANAAIRFHRVRSEGPECWSPEVIG